MSLLRSFKERVVGVVKKTGKVIYEVFNAAAHVILPSSFVFIGARTMTRLGYGIGLTAGGFVFFGTALTGLIQHIYQKIKPKSKSGLFMRRIRRGLSSGFFGLQALSIFALHLGIDILNPVFAILAGLFSIIFGYSQANNLEVDQLNAIKNAEEYHQKLREKLAETKGFWARLGMHCRLGRNQFRRLYQYLKECCKRNLPEKVWKWLELLETYANRTGKNDITALSLFCLYLDWYGLEWSASDYLSMIIMLLVGSGVGVADATTIVKRESCEGHVDDKMRAGVEGYVGSMYWCGLEEIIRTNQEDVYFTPFQTAMMSLFSAVMGLFAQGDIEFADLKHWEIKLYNRVLACCCPGCTPIPLPAEPLVDDAAVPDATRTIEDAVPPTPSTEAPGQKDPESGEEMEGKDDRSFASEGEKARVVLTTKEQEKAPSSRFSDCLRYFSFLSCRRTPYVEMGHSGSAEAIEMVDRSGVDDPSREIPNGPSV